VAGVATFAVSLQRNVPAAVEARTGDGAPESRFFPRPSSLSTTGNACGKKMASSAIRLRASPVAFGTLTRSSNAPHATSEILLSPAMSDHELPQALSALPQMRQRLRFTDFRFQRSADGRCRADVEFEGNDGARIRGTASGQSSPTVDLRVAADAALRAIESFSNDELSFELIGVKAVRAFDANVIIVSVANCRPHGPPRLIGSTLVENDPVRGAVVAVLSATNRMLGNFISTR
jgi:hypothetical protein